MAGASPSHHSVAGTAPDPTAPLPPEQEAQQLRAQLTGLDIPLFAVDIPRLKAFDKAFHAGVSVGDVKAGPNAARQVRKGAPRAQAKTALRPGKRAATRRRAG